MNRFSSDVGQVDEILAEYCFDTAQVLFISVAGIVLIALAVPPLVATFPVLGAAFYQIRKRYLLSSREIKRIDSVTRSPILTAFSADLDGVTTIRAYGKVGYTHQAFVTALNTNAKAWFWWLMMERWIGVRLDMLSWALLTLAAYLAVVLGHSGRVDAGLGLALTLNP